MNGLAIMENVRRYRTIASLYRRTRLSSRLIAAPSWRKPKNGSIAPLQSSKPILIASNSNRRWLTKARPATQQPTEQMPSS